MFWRVIGFSAAALTSFAFIPQILKIIKTKSVRDVSILTLLQFTAGILLWIAYGLHLKDPVIIAANAVSIFCLAFVFYLYFLYNARP